MPDVDGFTLARQIKRDQRLRNTPVVMLTSVGRAGDAERCRRLGVDAFLTKPVKHSDLLDTLATLFGVSTRREQDRRGSQDGGPVTASRRSTFSSPRTMP